MGKKTRTLHQRHQMVSKQMKTCSTSLITSEMQMKTCKIPLCTN